MPTRLTVYPASKLYETPVKTTYVGFGVFIYVFGPWFSLSSPQDVRL
jgi:hypothetical protein